jgi:hypothetical protein
MFHEYVAGKPVTVNLPAPLLKAAGDRPIRMHIGGWTDEIYKERDAFSRMPELVRFYTVNSTRTVIASAFGGLIYITLPEGLKLADQTLTVTGTRATSNKGSAACTPCMRRGGNPSWPRV